VLLGVTDFGLDVATAISSPRIHHQWSPDRTIVDEQLDDAIKQGLERRGHQVVVSPFQAAVQAVEVADDSGQRVFRAASDARKGGLAAAR
jgi:gamma-glutamyltranspeptidase